MYGSVGKDLRSRGKRRRRYPGSKKEEPRFSLVAGNLDGVRACACVRRARVCNVVYKAAAEGEKVLCCMYTAYQLTYYTLCILTP